VGGDKLAVRVAVRNPRHRRRARMRLTCTALVVGVHPAIVAIAAMIMKRPANIMARERMSISLSLEI
jgi:hypothetical protein